MVADTSDYEQWTSGRRIEGYFGATYQWVLKAGLSITVLISKLILTLVGFDVAKGAGQDLDRRDHESEGGGGGPAAAV